MRLSQRSLVRLACWTRRWDPIATPVRYRLARFVLKLIADHPMRHPPGPVVMPYDRGLIVADPATEMGYKIMFHGYHDPGLARLLRRITPPGAVCMDCGANVGAYALLMAFSAGPGGRVFCLEPNFVVAPELRRNIALNGLKNVTVLEAAIAEKSGKVAFFIPPVGAANRLVGGLKPVALADREATVRALSGAELQKMVEDGCDVVKIDVFGADLMAMRQMSGLVEQHRPAMVVEYRRPAWERYRARAEDALALFEDWDYAVFICRKGVTRRLDGPVPSVCNLVGVPLSQTSPRGF